MADPGAQVNEPRPLLAFGAPTAIAIPPDRRSFRPQPTRPPAGRQGQRLAPQFAALRDAMTADRVSVSDATTEPDPELVVVLDLAGTVEAFSRAVVGVPGLEFLAELEEDDAEPDEDFHFVDDGRTTAALVPETLYMVMSNAQAVTELISLFQRWQVNPEKPFARGLNPLRSVFGLLRAVRRWSPQDRVRETGLLDAWAEDVAA